MAARRVMTGAVVSILMLPSRREAGWRTALAEVTAAAGWRYLEAVTVAETPPSSDENTLIVASHCEIADPDPSWVIVRGKPDEAVTAIVLTHGATEAQATWYVAARLSSACELAERGAPVFSADADQLDVPGLGPVRYPQDAIATPQGPATVCNPLDFYRELPPEVGAQAEWDPGIYRLPIGDEPDGGPSLIDLTGRGRIIVHGPYIDLPKGLWRLTVEFLVDPEGGHTHLRFDWGVGMDVTTTSAHLTVPGRYEIELERNWLTRGVAQLRIWVDHGVFQGKLELVRTTVLKLAEIEDPRSAVTNP